MIPILYEKTGTKNNLVPLGAMVDVLSCPVTRERNGIYEATMLYPKDGQLAGELKPERLLYIKPGDDEDPQPMEIMTVTALNDNTIQVYTQHISYRLSGMVAPPFSAATATEAAAKLQQYMGEFTLTTDVVSDTSYSLSVPTACRSVLGGMEGSLLDVYGGEFVFDGWDVYWRQSAGSNRGVLIAYGKNLTDINAVADNTGVVTGVLPYYQQQNDDGTTSMIMPDDPVTVADSPLSYDRITTLDCSGEFETTPSVEQLQQFGANWLKNQYTKTTDSVTLSYLDLYSQGESDAIKSMEYVRLCDTVTVWDKRYNLQLTAKVVQIVYDPIAERNDSVQVGEATSSFADTILSTSQTVDKIQQTYPSRWQQSMYELAQKITGQTDSHVIFHPMEYPSVMIIAENTDLTAAGNSALYLSSAGISGTSDLAAAMADPSLFSLAITIDGHIMGDRIVGLTIQGEQIIGGIIQSPDGKVYINLQSGEAYVPRLIGTVGNNVHFGVEQGTFDISGADYSGMRFYRLQNVAPPFEDIEGDYFQILKTASGTWLRAISDSGKDVILELVGANGTESGRVFSVMGGAGLNRQFAVYETGRVDIARELWVGQWASGGTTGARIESGGNVVSRGGFYAQNTDDGNQAYMLPDGTVHGINISGFNGTFTSLSGETVSGITGSFSSSVSGGMLCLSTDSRASLRRLNATSTYSDYGLTFPDGSKFFICRMSGTGLATPCLQVDQSGITLASALNTNGYSIIYPHTGTFAVGGYDENGTLQNLMTFNSATSTADGRMANFYTHANFNNYTIYNTHIGTLSDRRYKKYIAKSQESALDIIDRMGMYRYTYKKAAGEGLAEKKVRFGQMADELQEVYPEAVIQDSASGTLYIDKMELVDLLLKSVQELSQEVKNLKNELKTRKETVNANRG